ncbi:MAG: WYL domain-containing protein [Eubacteriales bacterium]|nr:WYL domain-containing protein [Eubacteriales bacterium]
MEQNKRNRILYIEKLLVEQTDEQHPVTVTDILTYLEGLNITANRRTVMSDILQLQEAGLDIVCNKSRQNQYFIGDRQFELPELKLLVDAVQASKFISTKKSKVLIDKLSALTSVHQSDELNRQLYVDKQVKSNNEAIYYTVDILHSAINAKKQVEFKYNEYNQHKKKVYKHNGKVYVFSPYGLIWNSDSYYVIGYCKSHDKIIKFRVDRIAHPIISETPAVPKPDNFNIAEYSKTVFQMYEDETHEVVLECRNTLMKTIIDRFGDDVATEPAGKEHFKAIVTASTSNTFFGWVFSFGGDMKIIAPQEVKERYLALIKNSMV